jgi:GTP-binding protein HflX
VLALNKVDLLSEVARARVQRRFPEGIEVSALEREGIEGLLQGVDAALPAQPIEVELLIPYDRQEVVARLYREAEVVKELSGADGTTVEARLTEGQLAWAGEFTMRRVSRRRRLSG